MGEKFYYIGLRPDQDKRRLLIQATTELSRRVGAWETLEGRTNRAELRKASVDLVRSFNKKYNLHLRSASIF